MTAESILLFALGLYLIQVVTFIYGIIRKKDLRPSLATPVVSVIIAARNEEKNIESCLISVSNQTYPLSLFEIIVIDDNSTDATQMIVQSLSGKIRNLTVVSTGLNPESGGKTNALSIGIEQSKGEIILITDADCVVPRTWIASTVAHYEEQVGIVGGMTLQEATTPFQGMQSLDWAYLLGIASAAASLRNPLSTIGNNLSFRRNAYESVGGYRTINFSVTEDYALFQAIVKSGKWNYLYPIDPNLLVISKPCRTWKEIIRQKHRWGKGGLDMTLSGFAVMGIGFFLHVMILTAVLYGSFFAASACLLAKWVADYCFLNIVTRRLSRETDLRFFYFFEIYYHVYVLFLPFIVFFGGKVIWKGRSY